MKRFANEEEPVLGIPLIVEPIVIEDRLVAIRVQHRDVPMIVIVAREGAARSYWKPSGSPPIEISLG